MIKNIVFDLGNVILKDNPSSVLDNIQINNREQKFIEDNFFGHLSELDLGKITLEDHLNNCGLNFMLDEKLHTILLNYYKYRSFNTEIINLMHSLKGNNYGIYILSNNNKETANYLQKLPIFQCVNGWIISCDYNVVKPNKDIYIKLFEKYNLNPKECFFIDDNRENIEASRILGMDGHILNLKSEGIKELIKDMKKNNINC